RGLLRLRALVLALAVDQVGALRHRPDGVCDSVAHLVDGRLGDVAPVVAGLVVAGVVPLAGSAAVRRCLRGRLDALGAGEQTTGSNANLEERAVVGAAAELGLLAGQAL